MAIFKIPSGALWASFGLACVLFSGVGIYIGWGATPDARFSKNGLLGLTPDDVVARLGSPDFDDRVPPPKGIGWTAAKEPAWGPMTMRYLDRRRWRAFEYSVLFENGHVADVKVGAK
jgi:hypothetical protein